MPTSADTTAPASTPTIGAYDLILKIAEGGMGAVYKGRSQVTGDIVAIKIIPSDTAKNPVLLKRFEQEFRAASLLDHPNVVKAIEYNSSGANPFLVMEFVDGQTIGRCVERDGAFQEERAVHIIAQVCDGLHRAHKQGLIHRDVKPDNVLVTPDGTAKLTDLGLVKDIEGELNLTKTGRGLGTPHFMAPEQFRNAKNADVRCDIYSLGATLYMMLTGQTPFAKTSPLDCWMRKIKNEFPPPRKLNPAVSERVNWAVLRAMSADPAQRPASCREFLEDLTGQAWRGWAANNSGVSSGIGNGLDDPPSGTIDLWYLSYKNASGELQKVKGTTESIRQNVKAGLLGDSAAIMICRTKQGPFTPLRAAPEFRDLVIAPAAIDANKVSGKHVSPSPDTARAMFTVPQSKQGSKKVAKDDPAEDIETEVHKVRPIRKSGSPRIPMKPTPKDRSVDYMPWLILVLTVAAAVIGLLLFTRR